MTFKYIFGLLLLGLLPLFGQQSPLYEVNVSKYLMGTQVDAVVLHEDIPACKKALFFAFKEMERVEKLLGYSESGSEITRINQSAGKMPVKVSWETLSILQRAKDYSKRFEGIFDVSIGAVAAAWGFNSDKGVTPLEPEQAASLLQLVGFENIILEVADTTAFLKKPEMNIDLGGIAKGYAIDRAATVLREKGIKHFLLNAGGDIYAAGKKSPLEKWRIGIKHPRQENALAAAFNLENMAVATSGDYERFIEVDGKRYHHILDPRSGYPADICQSASVVAASAEEADVLATCLFILGKAQGNELLSASMIIDKNGSVHPSAGLVADYHLQLFD